MQDINTAAGYSDESQEADNYLTVPVLQYYRAEMTRPSKKEVVWCPLGYF